MVHYLTEEEIVEIAYMVLKISDELDQFEYRRPDYIKFTLDFAENFPPDKLYEIALAYCISIIVHHPFRNGNHRTSMISAEHFLLKNGFESSTTDEKDIELYKKRIELEKKNDYTLIRMFFNSVKDTMEISNLMHSEYGLLIDNWLKENYKKKDD